MLAAGRKERSVYSVLAYCYFNISDFQNAATCYQELTAICPEVLDYSHHLAQCLYKVNRTEEALEICNRLEHSYLKPKVQELRAAICYEKNDFKEAMRALHAVDTPDFQILVNEGCVHFKLE
jgi:tetratricopeptide repeat protein 30